MDEGKTGRPDRYPKIDVGCGHRNDMSKADYRYLYESSSSRSILLLFSYSPPFFAPCTVDCTLGT